MGLNVAEVLAGRALRPRHTLLSQVVTTPTYAPACMLLRRRRLLRGPVGPRGGGMRGTPRGQRRCAARHARVVRRLLAGRPHREVRMRRVGGRLHAQGSGSIGGAPRADALHSRPCAQQAPPAGRRRTTCVVCVPLLCVIAVRRTLSAGMPSASSTRMASSRGSHPSSWVAAVGSGTWVWRPCVPLLGQAQLRVPRKRLACNPRALQAQPSRRPRAARPVPSVAVPWPCAKWRPALTTLPNPPPHPITPAASSRLRRRTSAAGRPPAT